MADTELSPYSFYPSPLERLVILATIFLPCRAHFFCFFPLINSVLPRRVWLFGIPRTRPPIDCQQGKPLKKGICFPPSSLFTPVHRAFTISELFNSFNVGARFPSREYCSDAADERPLLGVNRRAAREGNQQHPSNRAFFFRLPRASYPRLQVYYPMPCPSDMLLFTLCLCICAAI